MDAARENSVLPIKTAIASVSQNVEVTAEAQGVDTTNAEISDTITMDEIRNLPILDRDALSVLQTQAGVVYNGNSNTVINGLRTSYSNVTLDGINIQDNYIRDNALDYTPNRLLLGQVRQMTMVSSNANAAASGGATETAFSTPSGTNQLHGEAFWYNRNNAFSANDWFNNQAGVAAAVPEPEPDRRFDRRPHQKGQALLLLQLRGRARAPADAASDDTILTATARAGHLHLSQHRRRAATGEPAGAARHHHHRPRYADPAQPGPRPAAQINNFDVGDSRRQPATPPATASTSAPTKPATTSPASIDYNITTSHAISGSLPLESRQLRPARSGKRLLR